MINLTITESDYELLDGFPESVSFNVDVPSTVYYTLDGTKPNEGSLIAVGKVFLPTLSGTLTIKAVAISGEDSSDIVSAVYENSSTNLGGPRHLKDEGIAVMRYDDEAVDNLAFDADGDATSSVSKPVKDLDIKASRTNSSGKYIANGKTSREFINFSKKGVRETPHHTSSPSSPSFDSSAGFIIIDGTTDEAREKQVVKIVNRPYNTFGPTTSFYKERLGQKEPIITGNFVRSFYNPKTGKYVSYYWESLESRWIRSEQTIEKKALKISNGPEGRFVYRWVQDRALSQLF